jgi:AraC-like DNA-binding protein
VAASLVAGSPWGLGLDAVPGAAFHALSAGTAWLRVDGHPPLQLMPGDAVLLPTGAPHTIAGDLDAPTTPFDHAAADAALGRGAELALGGTPASTRVLCASYQQDPATTIATFALLPTVLHLPAISATSGLRGTLALLADEVAHPGPGQRTVLDHIVNILLVQVLRAWLATSDPADRPPSWLRGLYSPITASALAAMHAEPHRNWTTGDLAARAKVSRATLVRQFQEHVGTTPNGYLTDWRLELAAHRLRIGDAPVSTIARGVGYTSEYAFNRAFARRHGCPPGRYRREHLQQSGNAR